MPHSHNDTDSQKLVFREAIEGVPFDALTPGTSSTAGGTYTATEQAMINNMKTRIEELESRLEQLGLLP